MQGPRDRRRRQGQHVDHLPQAFQLLLVLDAEALLFVDDDQAQVLELHVVADEPVGADDDVDAPVGQPLDDALLLRVRLEPAQALERLAHIRVLHLHGSLGDRLWNDGSTTERGYDPIHTAASAQAAAKRIKIMHEVEPGDEFTTAKALLAMAEEIIFLGFGFHAINLQRLGLQEIIDLKAREGKTGQWLASRTGMGVSDINRARRHLHQIDVGFAPESAWNILDFLKNTRCLLG